MCCTSSSSLLTRQGEINERTEELFDVDDVMDSMSVRTTLPCFQPNCISLICDD